MNRSKQIFGNDACEWKPERWIAISPEDENRISSMNQDLVTVSSSACLKWRAILTERQVRNGKQKLRGPQSCAGGGP